MIQRFTREEIIQMLREFPEQSKFDWKRDINISNANKKSEITKDVISIANAHGTSDGYILYGVDPSEENPIIGINTSVDDANLQQIINSKVNKPIEFLYFEQEIDGNPIGIIKITKNQKRPFIVEHDFGILKKGTIPIRKGSSTGFVSGEDLEKMHYEPHRVDHIHIKAKALLEKIYNDLPISAIVGEYHEIMKMVGDDEEIEWATFELKGYPSAVDQKKFGYRKLNGYLSFYDIQNPGFYNFEQIRLENPDGYTTFIVFMNQPILTLEQYIPKGSNENLFLKMSFPSQSLIDYGFESDLFKQADKVLFYLLPIEIERAMLSIKQRILDRLISL